MNTNTLLPLKVRLEKLYTKKRRAEDNPDEPLARVLRYTVGEVRNEKFYKCCLREALSGNK